jgi:DNA-binding MarR family transcriptional regulator
MRNKSSLNEIRDLYRLHAVFKQTFEAAYKSRQTELRKYGITPEQATALILVKTIGKKATPSEVSGWLFREPHSTLNLLRRMEKQGLVNMGPDSGNKHLIRISLTEKGDEAYYHAIKYDSSTKTYAALSEEQRQQLWSILQILRERALKNLKMDSKSTSRLTAALMRPLSDIKDTPK